MYMYKAKEYIKKGFKPNSSPNDKERFEQNSSPNDDDVVDNDDDDGDDDDEKKIDKNYLLSIPPVVLFMCLCWYRVLFYPDAINMEYLSPDITKYNTDFWAFTKIVDHLGFFFLYTTISFLISVLIVWEGKPPLNDFYTWVVFIVISFFIFLGTFTLIGICTSFVEVFENTIGVSLLKKEDLNKVFGKFKPKTCPDAKIDLTYLVRLFNVNNFTDYFENFMKTAILNETTKGSPFIDLKYEYVNEYDEKVKKKENQEVNEETTAFLAAFKDVMDKGLKYAQPASKPLYESHYIVSGQEDKYKIGELRQNLFDICLKKFTTGHLTWMYFASLISILASISQIV